MAGEGLEGSEQRAWTVRQPHGERHFAGAGACELLGLVCGAQQDEAGEILGVVLDACGENDAAVMLSGAAAGDGRAAFVTARKRFADAACRVFGRHTLQVWVRCEEALALSQGHGVRSHGANLGESGAGAADEVMLDRQNRFRDDGKIAFEKKVVDAHD